MPQSKPPVPDRIDEVPRDLTVDTITDQHIELVQAHARMTGNTWLGERCRLALTSEGWLTRHTTRLHIAAYLRNRKPGA